MAEEKAYLSLADLDQMQGEELAGLDVNADANAQLAPIPAGMYLVKVTHQAEDSSKYWERKHSKAGAPYLTTTLVGEIVDNLVNPSETVGRKVIANNIMTLVMEQTGTTQVQAVLQALGKWAEAANGPQTDTRHAKLLSQAIGAGVLVGVVVDWEGSFYSTEEKKDLYKRVRGMKNFPKDEKTGKYVPVVKSPDGLMEAEARTFVRRWVPMTEVLNGKQQTQADTVTASIAAEVVKPQVKKKQNAA